MAWVQTIADHKTGSDQSMDQSAASLPKETIHVSIRAVFLND